MKPTQELLSAMASLFNAGGFRITEMKNPEREGQSTSVYMGEQIRYMQGVFDDF